MKLLKSSFYLTYKERKIRLTTKPAYFQRVLSSSQRLAIRRFFLFDWAFSLLPQRCDEQLLGDAPHGCMMSSLAKRLPRMDRAPGFGGSSRIAIGKEVASDEDRRRL
jgi:hypothetical protein